MDDDFFSDVPSSRSNNDVVAAPTILQQSPKVATTTEARQVSPPSVSAITTSPPQKPQVPTVAVSAGTELAAKREQAYAEQQRAIAERLSQRDNELREKEQILRKQAQTALSDTFDQREKKLKIVRADHVAQQQEFEAKRQELKKSGAVWGSVAILVDLKKPSIYSKNVEKMRGLLNRLGSSAAH